MKYTRLFLLVLVFLSPSALLAQRTIPVWSIYPRLAITAGLSGTVHLRVQFDKNGIVKDVRAVDGHVLLYEASRESVKQWRFSATGVDEEVVVTFVYVIDQTVKGERMEWNVQTRTMTVTMARPPVSMSQSKK